MKAFTPKHKTNKTAELLKKHSTLIHIIVVLFVAILMVNNCPTDLTHQGFHTVTEDGFWGIVIGVLEIIAGLLLWLWTALWPFLIYVATLWFIKNIVYNSTRLAIHDEFEQIHGIKYEKED